jgi:hypothetical protein
LRFLWLLRWLFCLGRGLGLCFFLVDYGGVFAVSGGREDRVGGLVDEGAAVFAERPDEGGYLRGQCYGGDGKLGWVVGD